MVAKILLVDDDKPTLDSMVRILGRKFEIHAVCSGREGLELLKDAGPFAVVVSDMMMPNMNGVQFLNEARRLSPATVRIMLTGDPDKTTVISAVNQAGIFRFHSKPVSAKKLAETIQEGVKHFQHETALILEHQSLNKRTAQIEDALRHATLGAEIAQTARTEFLANLNHELRTPLNHILGFTELLLHGRNNKLKPEVIEEYANYILESGAHLLALINNMIELSRFRSNPGQMHEVNFGIKDLLRDCLGEISAMAAKAKIRIEIDLAPDLPPMQGDRRLMQKALMNLLHNSVRFSPPDSRVGVAVGLNKSGELVVEIEDDGIGIEPDKIEDLLVPFQQADGSMTRKYDGVGVGLPLAKAIAEQHGGRLILESQMGKGTKVRMLIPSSRLIATGRETA